MLGSLIKSALNVAVTPIEVVKDFVTLGGSLTDQDKPYTIQRLEKAQEHLDDALD
jgi:hypothetical protein